MSDTILLNVSGQEAPPNICIQTEVDPINLIINERLVETTVWDDLIGTVNHIPFNTSPTGVPETAGTAYWNSTDGTVSFKLLNGTDLQNGQELFFYGKAVGAIANGDLCQFVGVQGDHILIKKAVGSEIDANPSYIVGIATQNIANGEFGYVTWFGKVNGVFTTGWSIGDILYFDVATGQLTNVMPTAPNRVIEIAAVIKTATGASENGVLIVRPTFGKRFTDLDDVNGTALTTSGQIPVWDNINQVFDFTVNVHGKAPYHGVVSAGTLSFNNSTHVLSVPALTYWNQGVLVEHTTTVSCDLDSFVSVTSAPMLYFVYFDSNNVFKASTTHWNIKTDVLIATVSWNGSVGVIGNECHGYTRNLDWHQNAHLTIGTRYETGLAQIAPSTALDSTIDLSAGVLWDEDIRISIAQQTQCRVWYRNTNGTYTFDSTPSSAPYKWNGATSRVQYLDTDTNTLVDLTAAQYVPMWVYGTSDTTVPIYVLVGEISAPYASVAAARAASPPVLASSTLNPESKLLYRWIYRGDGQYQEAVDYRSSSSLPAGGTPATNAASVTFSPSGNIATTNVQSAIEELDQEKEAVGSTASHATLTSTHGVSGDIVGTASTQTLINKTISLANNTVSGTLAQFNAAVSDADLLDTATAASTYAPIAKGVTNGDTHDHSGGDGAQIAYSSLRDAPTSMVPPDGDKSDIVVSGGGSNWTVKSVAGNLAFLGTGARIRGDFSNTTIANRTMFQTSIVNGNSQLEIIPNGTSTVANYVVSNNSADPANTSLGSLFVDSVSVRLQSTVRGTGTYLPMAFHTGGSETLRLTTDKRIQADFSNATIANRAMFQTSTANAASAVGAIPNGTGNSSSFVALNTSDSNNAGYLSVLANNTTTALISAAIGTGSYLPMTFYTGGYERMRIDTSGNVTLSSAAGLGYGTGAGGTVTQATSKSTAVTLNKPCGQIAMNNAALAAGATANFVLYNNLLSSTDALYVAIKHQSVSNATAYNTWATVDTGAASISIKNISSGPLPEAVVINFAIIKGATS